MVLFVLLPVLYRNKTLRYSINSNVIFVCLFFGPGADRWQNGADVVVDYNTADPLIRWDSYQNICDGEGTVTTLH